MQTTGEVLAVPFRIDDTRRPAIGSVQLFTSRDEGRTWKMIDEAPPTAKQFRIQPTEEGMHWFAVVAVDKQGRRDNADPANLRPEIKVNVTGRR